MSERMFFSICQSQYRCDATWYPTQSNFSPVAFIFFLFFLFFVCVFCVLLRPVFAIGNAALRKNNSPGQREMVNAAHFILLCKTNDCKYCLAKMHGAEVAIQKQSQPSDFIFLFYVWIGRPSALVCDQNSYSESNLPNENLGESDVCRLISISRLLFISLAIRALPAATDRRRFLWMIRAINIHPGRFIELKTHVCWYGDLPNLLRHWHSTRKMLA